jgi:3-deoxy-D-manno-octulosonic acid kinase
MPLMPLNRLASSVPITHENRVSGQAACSVRTTGSVWQQSPIADSRMIQTVAGGVATKDTVTSVECVRSGATLIVHESAQIPEIVDHHFDPAWWRDQGAQIGTAKGRGQVYFVRARDHVWALRHYRRGGLMARFLVDSYWWQGLEQTRPWREWHLLRALHSQGFPVPVPVAARVIRHGLFYRGDLITRRIEGAVTLAQVLEEQPLARGAWQRIGRLLGHFHQAGLRHDDINVSNILMDAESGFHLIDFDKAFLTAPGAWRAQNLARFERSLLKQVKRNPRFAFDPAAWNALLNGYADLDDSRGRSAKPEFA